MDLSIIIVNWNVKNLLEKCLKSVYEQTNDLSFEVIVVDNASSDGSVEMIKEKFPQVKLIVNKENKWFAGGNNQGLKIAQGDLILLLNPDTVVLDKAINKMVKIMREGGADIGVLGSKLLNADMTVQPSCRRLPSLSDQALILLKLHNFFPKLTPIKRYYMADFRYDMNREVEQVMGASLMTRKIIIDKIGGLDADYGSIFEEVDFCTRVKNLHFNSEKYWKVYFTSDAEVIHYKGQSFRQRKIIANQMNFNYALLRYFRKYKPFKDYFILLCLWPFSMGLAALDQTMISLRIKKFKAAFKKRDF